MRPWPWPSLRQFQQEQTYVAGSQEANAKTLCPTTRGHHLPCGRASGGVDGVGGCAVFLIWVEAAEFSSDRVRRSHEPAMARLRCVEECFVLEETGAAHGAAKIISVHGHRDAHFM